VGEYFTSRRDGVVAGVFVLRCARATALLSARLYAIYELVLDFR
jgi:hypothetical protein